MQAGCVRRRSGVQEFTAPIWWLESLQQRVSIVSLYRDRRGIIGTVDDIHPALPIIRNMPSFP